MTCNKKFHGPNSTPRKGVTAIILRIIIRLRRYRDALGKIIQRLGRRQLRAFDAGLKNSCRLRGANAGPPI
jgi:hypothetical protein